MTESDFQLPDIFDVSPEAVAAAEASLDPDVKPPVGAREDTDKKTGDKYYRWTEAVTLEVVQRKRSASGLTEFYVQAKVRPGAVPSKNVGKRVFSRYRINFKVLNGMESNPKHEIMNRLSMPSIMSLLKATGFAPSDPNAGLPASLLLHLFPAEVETHESPLTGKVLLASICDAPNKGGKRPRQTEVETWVAAPMDETEPSITVE